MSSNQEESKFRYTHIIIGAGSSGCVVAARLATHPEFNVLLIEAGPDYPTSESLPDDLVNAAVPSQTRHDWGIKSTGTGIRTINMARGKVVGGSSAINACIALRAEPTDFNEWIGDEDVSWSWDAVLPYYKKLESDLDFPESDFHNNNGPLPIRRWKDSELHPLSAAFIEACSLAKFQIITDHNSPNSTGCGVLPMNAVDGRRFSAADMYLAPVRKRSNLTIISDSIVDRILFNDKKAIGVRTITNGEERLYYSENITLSAGAFGTPSILLRSGIGPASELKALGIPLIADLPGVGANLSDHSQVPIGITAKDNFNATDKPPCIQALLRYSSKYSRSANDMQICLLNEVETKVFAPYLLTETEGKKVFFLTSNLMLPESRGRVALTSIDPLENPTIEIDFCKEKMDVERHRDGIKLACSLLNTAAFSGLASEILEKDVLFKDDKRLNKFILDRIQTAHHPCGTAKMGSVTDPMSVVDAKCGVIGVGGLSVADASIIPMPIRANTNLTCIMIGEKFASELMTEAKDKI
jgi:choline dehydrogenase